MYWDIKDYLKKLDNYGVLEEAIQYIKDNYKWNDDEFDELRRDLRSHLALIDIKKKYPLKMLQKKRDDLKELPNEIEGLEDDVNCLQEEIDDLKKQIQTKKDLYERLSKKPPSEVKEEKPKQKRPLKRSTQIADLPLSFD